MVRVPLVRLRLTSLRVVAVPDPLQEVMYKECIHLAQYTYTNATNVTYITGFVASTMLLSSPTNIITHRSPSEVD